MDEKKKQIRWAVYKKMQEITDNAVSVTKALMFEMRIFNGLRIC